MAFLKTFLNVGDTAGVASLLAKYLRVFESVESDVVNFSHLDPMGITRHYNGEILKRSRLTSLRLLLRSRYYPAVHLHVHVGQARRLKLLYPKKKVIVHWHGEELRIRGWDGVAGINRYADLTFVSTQDLMEGAPPGTVYLPNPVDTELFRPLPEGRRDRSALYFVKHQRSEDTEWARRVASGLGLDLDLRDRVTEPVLYPEMPSLLNRYEYYIDRNYIHSLSKTALEALACGLKVVDWNGDVRQSLPAEHLPRSVIKRFTAALRERSLGSLLRREASIQEESDLDA